MEIEIEFFHFLVEHFLYDRSQGHHMSAYIQGDIQEEDENMEEVKCKIFTLLTLVLHTICERSRPLQDRILETSP